MLFTYRRLPLAHIFISLFTLVVLRSGPAYAEWVVVSGDESGTTAYVDPGTIRRNGDLVKMWTRYDSILERLGRIIIEPGQGHGGKGKVPVDSSPSCC